MSNENEKRMREEKGRTEKIVGEKEMVEEWRKRGRVGGGNRGRC